MSFSDNYGGPGNMFKQIGWLRQGQSRQIYLQAGRYYVINADVPFRSSGGDYVFEITGASLAKNMGGSEIDIQSENIITIPEEFCLNQNYPNPFHPSTTIEFGIPEATDVKINIYDIQGRLVTTLVNSNISAGFHKVIWNASEYSSGIYFVKMSTDQFTKTMKISLLK